MLSIRANQEDFTKDAIFSTVLFLYRKGKLSLGKAAEMIGISRLEFIEKLQREKEVVFYYSDNELDELIEDAGKLP